VITFELGFFIDKFYLVGYSLVFIVSYLNQKNNQSNLIIISLTLIHCLFTMFLRGETSFYTFYLWAAFTLSSVILLSIIIHLFFQIKHQKTTVKVYYLYILSSIGYLIIHRVRVVIYDTDDPIFWLMNLQSGYNITLSFLAICLFVYGCNIKWKSQYGRLFS